MGFEKGRKNIIITEGRDENKSPQEAREGTKAMEETLRDIKIEIKNLEGKLSNSDSMRPEDLRRARDHKQIWETKKKEILTKIEALKVKEGALRSLHEIQDELRVIGPRLKEIKIEKATKLENSRLRYQNENRGKKTFFSRLSELSELLLLRESWTLTDEEFNNLRKLEDEKEKLLARIDKLKLNILEIKRKIDATALEAATAATVVAAVAVVIAEVTAEAAACGGVDGGDGGDGGVCCGAD